MTVLQIAQASTGEPGVVASSSTPYVTDEPYQEPSRDQDIWPTDQKAENQYLSPYVLSPALFALAFCICAVCLLAYDHCSLREQQEPAEQPTVKQEPHTKEKTVLRSAVRYEPIGQNLNGSMSTEELTEIYKSVSMFPDPKRKMI